MGHDPKEIERLRIEAGNASDIRDECGRAIEDMFASDAEWTEADTRKYERLKARYDWSASRLFQLSANINALEEAKPKSDADLRRIRSKPLNRWARGGSGQLSADERIDQQNRLDTFGNDADTAHPKFVVPFDLTGTKGPQGAVTTPADTNARERYIDQDYYETMSEYGGLSKVISTIYTEHGNDIRFLTNQSDEGFSQTIARNADVDAAQPAAGNNWDINPQDLNTQSTIIRPYLYNSGLARINAATFEDVGFDVGDWAKDTLFRRLGKKLEDDIMRGEVLDSGTPVLRGLWSATGEHNLPDNDPAAFYYADALGLSRAIDDAYLYGEKGIGGYQRSEGIVAFVCSYQLTNTIKSFTERSVAAAPLYRPSIGMDGVYTMHGFPVYWTHSWNDDQDEVANNQHPIAFGNWGYLTQRYCGGGVMISRFYDSATAVTNQVTYMAHVRWGVNCLGPKNSGGKSLAIIKGKIIST